MRLLNHVVVACVGSRCRRHRVGVLCRFITRLLLVHGRWSHKRNAEIVQYAFYKELVYSLPNIYFGFASGARLHFDNGILCKQHALMLMA